MKLLVILAILYNGHVWQSPQGCQTWLTRVGNWHALVSNVDHASATCTNWYLQVFDASRNQG